MHFPISIFLLFYLFMVIMFVVFSFFLVYHALCFGVATLGNILTLGVYLSVSALILIISYAYIATVDWGMAITLF